MSAASRLTIPKEVMARQVGDETVILNLVSGTYFGLDPVGARIWQLIGQGLNLTDICDTLLTEFDVTHENLQRDIAKLVVELQDQGLVIATAP